MKMKTAKRLDGIGEYYFSKKLAEIEAMNNQGKSVINLGIGSPDLPVHPDVIAELNRSAQQPGSNMYQSYRGSKQLRTAMSEWYHRWYGVSLDADSEILPLLGSKEGILHICMTYLNKNDLVLVPDPGYPTYTSAIKLAGAIPVPYPVISKKRNAWKKIGHLKTGRVKLMFLNYPQMPTGETASDELFEELLDFAKKHDILLVHDNPYSFILSDEPKSMLSIPGAIEHVIELNSLSKSHNMSGWRVGMLCGSAERVNDVLRFKSNMDSGMFLPVQMAAVKALSLGKEWFDEMNAVYRERKKAVLSLLHLLGSKVETEQAGLFVWASVPSAYKNGYVLSDEILEKANVFITPGGIFGKRGKKYIRVSLCKPVDQIEEATQRIAKHFSTNNI